MTDIVIKKIFEVHEAHSLLKIKLKLTLRWIDVRLKYLDLKNITVMNTVIASDLEEIWAPVLLFPNTKNGQRVSFKNESAAVEIEINGGKMCFSYTRKCPLRGHILAPPEGLRALEVPGQPRGLTPGVRR